MKIKDPKIWMASPDPPRPSRKSLGGALEFDGNRKDQTAVSRLLSGCLKGMTFESGRKVSRLVPSVTYCRLPLNISSVVWGSLWKMSMRVNLCLRIIEKKLYKEVWDIKRIQICTANHDPKRLLSVLGGVVHKSVGGNRPALLQHLSCHHPHSNMERFTNTELADRHPIYQSEEGNAPHQKNCITQGIQGEMHRSDGCHMLHSYGSLRGWSTNDSNSQPDPALTNTYFRGSQSRVSSFFYVSYHFPITFPTVGCSANQNPCDVPLPPLEDQWIQEISFTRTPGSGRPRQTSRRGDRHIVRNARVQPTALSADIQARVALSLGAPFSSRTIRRRLAERHLGSWRPLLVLNLTLTHQRLRLVWCHARGNWTATECNQVVFSDESRLNLSIDNDRVRLWRLRGERFNPDFVYSDTPLPQLYRLTISSVGYSSSSPLERVVAIHPGMARVDKPRQQPGQASEGIVQKVISGG
ncbi:transposable element Tcb2 transposase [Trichonephila clavipes]|nr:transposable element Tcb2 transposase [Trichonephila clavipes]